MIDEIQVRRVDISKGILNDSVYKPVDITKQVSMPIIDVERSDSILDSSSLVVYNKSKKTFKPFTRIIIKTTESEDDSRIDNYIYRYMDYDDCNKIVGGENPIYRHNLQLIEPTKILERVTVDNLTFTNYLDENYNTDSEVSYNGDIWTKGGFDAYLVGFNNPHVYPSYKDGNRFVGIYHHVGDTINTNVGFNVYVEYYLDKIFGLEWNKYRSSLSLDRYYVIDPDGQEIEIVGNDFTFSKLGEYKIKQYYRYQALATFEATWIMYVVESIENTPQKYSIKEVIERLLSVCETRRVGLDLPKFKLEEGIKDRLQNILSPEFSFTQTTLFEALSKIGDHIHAIPRLIPDVWYDYEYDKEGNIINSKRNDYTNWNIITFDFISDKTEEHSTAYSLYHTEHSIDDYADNYVSNLQNATFSNYNNTASIVEPFSGGFLSARTESSNFEISNNGALFETIKRIKHVVSTKFHFHDQVKDVTAQVVKLDRYNILKTNTDTTDFYSNKAFYIYYEEGKKHLRGLTYLRDNVSDLGGYEPRIALVNILQLYFGKEFKDADINDVSIQIEYIPFEDIKIRQYKEYQGDRTESSTLYFNQQANDLDIDAFGEHVKGVLLQTGNQRKELTKYYNSLKSIPTIKTSSNQDHAFVISKELSVGTPIKTTVSYTENFNELNGYTSIKNNVREFEISEKEAVNRNSDYQEFCIVDTDYDLNKYWQDITEQERDNISSRLSTIGYGDEVIKQISDSLANVNNRPKAISSAVIKTIATDIDGSEIVSTFLLPVSCTAVGNSIVTHINLEDNYSSASTTKTASNKNYYLEDYISYVNRFGRFNTLHLGLMTNNPLKNFNVNSDSHKLYLIDEENINHNNMIVDYYNNYPFEINKDNREKISITSQLNFVTTNKNIWIGWALTHTCPLIGAKDVKFKLAIFKKKPNRTDLILDTDSYVVNGEGAFVVGYSLNNKHISIEPRKSCTDGVGYGIIDNKGRLVIYVDEAIANTEMTKRIYLMFRKNI